MFRNQNKHIFERYGLQDPNYSYLYIKVTFLPFDLGRHHARYYIVQKRPGILNVSEMNDNVKTSLQIQSAKEKY